MGGAEEIKCSRGLGSGLGLTRPRVTWWYALDWGGGQARQVLWLTCWVVLSGYFLSLGRSGFWLHCQ